MTNQTDNTPQAGPPKSTLSTTAFRVAATVVAVFSLLAAAIMWFVSNQTGKVMTRQVLVSLTSEAAVLKARARDHGIDGLARAIQLRTSTVGHGLYYLADTSGTKVAGNLSQLPASLRDDRAGGVFHYMPRPDDPRDAAKPTKRLGVGIALSFPDAILVVARDIEDQRALSFQIRFVSLLGFGLLAIAGLVTGLVMSRLALTRVDEITDTSRAIMAGDLSERLPRTGSGDEFDRLAANLNEMLARIEQLMHGLREVSDNIAHDLKTPLNRLRNRAEEALRDPRGPKAHQLGLERTIEAADDLIKTFNALLLIARLEAGAIEETFEDVDLVAVVNDVAELYEPVATDAGLHLVVEGRSGPQTIVPMNRQLVGQSVANMIDNAIKYSRATRNQPDRPETGKDIRVSVTAMPEGVEIAIGDSGPGIALADRERVLKRFVRLEKSRTAPGTGLGLSLVAAVARLHGATVRLEDNHPGLRVIVVFPHAKQ